MMISSTVIAMLALVAGAGAQEVPGGLCNPAPPISAAISTLPELEDLTIALQTAGTDSDGVLSSPQSAPVVLVAPTNDAFNVLAEALNAPVEALLNEAGVMRTILGYHLIKNGNCDGKLSGAVTTAHKGETLTFGDNTVTDASGNTANIVKVVPVGNGAVILVDLVMLPSSE